MSRAKLKPRSLATWVALIFGVLVFVSLLLTLLFSYRVSSQAVTQEIDRNLLQAHTTLTGLIEARMGLIGAHVADAARNPLFVGKTHADQLAPFLDSAVGYYRNASVKPPLLTG